MSKLIFRKDGPVQVSNTDFTLYQELRPTSNVSSGYYIWIDENYSDGVRRLALRDVLHHDDRNALKYFEFSCGSVFMPKELSIEDTLRFRPKLLQELQEELYYCLKQGIRIYEPTKIQLIEFILQFCNDDINRKFWYYHPLKQNLEQGCVAGLLELCYPSRKMPEWLCQEIWTQITQHAVDNLKYTNLFVVSEHGYRSISCYYAGIALKKLCDFFSDTVPNEDKNVIAEQIAYWLEENLPKDVIYNSFYTDYGIVRYAKHFRDIDLTYRVLRRHFMNLPVFQENGEPTISKGINYFLWLRGLIMQVAPDDRDFLQCVDDVIASKPQEPKIVYH